MANALAKARAGSKCLVEMGRVGVERELRKQPYVGFQHGLAEAGTIADGWQHRAESL
jgi:hypothetical protein